MRKQQKRPLSQDHKLRYPEQHEPLGIELDSSSTPTDRGTKWFQSLFINQLIEFSTKELWLATCIIFFSLSLYISHNYLPEFAGCLWSRQKFIVKLNSIRIPFIELKHKLKCKPNNGFKNGSSSLPSRKATHILISLPYFTMLNKLKSFVLNSNLQPLGFLLR